MGQDKAFLPWGPRTLIEHVIETLRPVVDELIVSVKDPRRFQYLPVRVVEDVVLDAHALGGLYTGVGVASNPRCFVCGCDAPFLNPTLIQYLLEQAEGYDLVVPRTAQGLHPLHAVYAKSALPTIERQLRQGRWDLQALVPALRARIIGPQVWRRLDREGRSFSNLNTPADYAAARRLAANLTRIMEPTPSPR
ncbi:MAG: molybdenum cofactor guanylyltransferase [Candidatus Omnitrophica bacterium]|nr:molybdenum cofactor guanylyltransferase [Candidatus Omnitrophota bacterium]